MIKNLLVDCDSTILGAEILEVLFLLVYPPGEKREKVLEKIREITAKGMNGLLPFNESLQQRIALLKLEKKHLGICVKQLSPKISPSFQKVLPLLLNNYTLIVISGAFREIINPLLTPLGIRADNIYANTFKFSGNVFQGINTDNPLAQANGKVKVAKNLGLLPEETIVIGDGFTDFEIKAGKLADYFIYYREFVNREKVRELADFSINNFTELLPLLAQLS